MMTILNESFLLDSNVLIYSQNEGSEFFDQAKKILLDCGVGLKEGVIAHQNVSEFIRTYYQVYKRPLKEVLVVADEFLFHSNLKVISPLASTVSTFIDLLKSGDSGKFDVYDYYLAATMIDNGVETILTANSKDFVKVKGIKVVDLREI